MQYFFILLMYIGIGVCYYKLACKTDNQDIAYMAFIPILNIYLMVKMADYSGLYLLLLFIPIVNVIFIALIFMKISSFVGKSPWLGLLMFIPLVNIIVLIYLAFSEKPERLVL